MGGAVVHRDIKPLNLIIERRRQRLKVLDFGIAKMADSGITAAGMMIGTANYMSPEQMRGDATIDHRSDIFSVGATVFELLTGTRAFPGSISDGLMGRIMQQPAPSLAATIAGLPEELDGIVAHALEKDPNHRYGDLVQMRDEVRALRHRLKEVDEQTVVLPSPAAAAEAGQAPATGRSAGATSKGSVTAPALPGATATSPAAPQAPTMTAAGSGAAATMTKVPAATGSAAAMAPPPPVSVTAAGPAAAAGTPGRASSVLVFLGIAAAVVAALAGAAWWLVPWDTVLRPWRPREAPASTAAAGTGTEAAEGAPGATVDEGAARRAQVLEAAKARLAGVTITVDAQPWAEVRFVPALADADVLALPPEVV
nr:serine/threonine protein kinase [Vicinamibacterales bacterium]